MESLADFILKFSHTLRITLKSESIISISYFPKSKLSQISRVLLATIRNLGSFPCPRCLISKDKLPEVGTKIDDKRRVTNQRVANNHLFSDVRLARTWIYNEGYGVKAAAVERLLSPISIVPTVVRLWVNNIIHGLLTLIMNRTPFPSYQSLGLIITKCWSLILCMSLSLGLGRPSSNTSSVFCLLKEARRSRLSMNDSGRFQHLVVRQSGVSRRTLPIQRSWLRGTMRIYYKYVSLDLYYAVALKSIIIVCNSRFRRPCWWTSQQKYPLIAFYLCRMACTGKTPSAHWLHAWLAWSINKWTRDGDSQVCTAHLSVLWHCRVTGRGGSTGTSPSSETW